MLGARISDKAMADASIGRICSYGTGAGREYGRICRVTASELVLDRLSLTEGRFEPHPVPVCPSSRNRVTYMKRDVRLVEPEVSPIKTLTDKETELLEALLKANRLKTLAERVRVLESETRELRESASFYEDDDPSKWPAEILECEALEERVKKLNETEERIKELRLLLKTV